MLLSLCNHGPFLSTHNSPHHSPLPFSSAPPTCCLPTECLTQIRLAVLRCIGYELCCVLGAALGLLGVALAGAAAFGLSKGKALPAGTRAEQHGQAQVTHLLPRLSATIVASQLPVAQLGCCSDLCRVQSGTQQMAADAQLEAVYSDGPEWSCAQCTLCNR